jgi:hypothetical protein
MSRCDIDPEWTSEENGASVGVCVSHARAGRDAPEKVRFTLVPISDQTYGYQTHNWAAA